MTITYATDHDAFENAIVAWLRTYATFNNNVIYANQTAVRPATPFATYQIISEGVLEGIDSEFVQFNPQSNRLDYLTHGPRRMTVQVTVFTEPGAEDVAGRSARMRLNGALAALRSQPVKKLFNDAGLAFLQMLGPPIQSDEQLGDRWERRMQADIELGYTSLVTDISVGSEGGIIETAEDVEVTYK